MNPVRGSLSSTCAHYIRTSLSLRSLFSLFSLSLLSRSLLSRHSLLSCALALSRSLALSHPPARALCRGDASDPSRERPIARAVETPP